LLSWAPWTSVRVLAAGKGRGSQCRTDLQWLNQIGI
jgi:hypothetical protein